MKLRYFAGVSAIIGALLSAQAMAADYIIDKQGQHAFITFKASHLGYSYIVGRFNDFDGDFSHFASKPEESSVNVTINAKSLDTNHAERDKHLRGPDFFNVAKYPTITFNSTSYKADGDNAKLVGDLTLHGITRSVEIDVNHVGEGNDPWGGYRSGFYGEVTLNAADYGMPDWVGKVDVELVVEGIRQSAVDK